MLKNLKVYYFFILLSAFVACTKQVDDTAVVIPPVTPTSIPTIKFFNVVDQGKITVKLNGTVVSDSLAQYYPTTYITAKADSNNIQLFKASSRDTTILNINVGLLKGKNYSCFIYKLGYDWKASIVTDNLTKPDSGYAGIRILDFRTQSNTNYVSINLFSLGYITYTGTFPFIYRHFLDHSSFDFLTNFTPVMARPDYKIVVYNSTDNLVTRNNVTLGSKKLYSMILMTPASITADSTANKYIFPDVQEHY